VTLFIVKNGEISAVEAHLSNSMIITTTVDGAEYSGSYSSPTLSSELYMDLEIFFSPEDAFVSETKKILEFLASEKERLADIVDVRFEKINRTVQECKKLSR